jgi:hypothetical protein
MTISYRDMSESEMREIVDQIPDELITRLQADDYTVIREIVTFIFDPANQPQQVS